MRSIAKRLALVAALGTLSASAAGAQEPPPRDAGPEASSASVDEWDEEFFPLEDVDDGAEAGATTETFDDESDPHAPILETMVTGSRIRRSQADAPGAERLGRERLEESGADTLADLLERVAGVQVQSSLGTGSEVVLDGLGGKYVLIVIDGQPVNGFVNDRVDLDRLGIHVEDVEHVDVVRGPMSAVYGSQALGGVIHIVTRRPRSTPRLFLQLGTRLSPGGLSRESLAISGSGGVGPLALRLSLSGLHDEAIDRGHVDAGGDVRLVPDGAYDLPHRRLGDARVFLSLYALEHLTLRSSLWLSLSQLETRQSGAIPSRDATDTGQLDVTVSAEWEPAREHEVIASARVSRFTHRFFRLPDGDVKDPASFCVEEEGRWRFFDPPCARPPRTESDALQDLGRFELLHRAEWLRDLPLVVRLDTAVGAVLELQRGRRLDEDGGDTLQGKGSRTLTALYGEARYLPLEGVTLSPGVRVDAAFLENDPTAPVVGLGPKLSARFDLPFGLFTQLAFGQGFRVPSFNEQHLRFDHSELGYIVEGNPALRPERSSGVRLESGLATSAFTLRGEVFANAFEDLIAERLIGQNDVGVAIYSYENRARAWTAGAHLRVALAPVWGVSLESGLEWLPVAHDATACGGWLPCFEDDGGARLPQRATFSGHLSARYAVPRSGTTVFSQVQVLGARAIDESTEAPPYALVALGLRQALPGDLTLTASLDNFLDSYHPSYGPKPGLAVRAALRGAWSAE